MNELNQLIQCSAINTTYQIKDARNVDPTDCYSVVL